MNTSRNTTIVPAELDAAAALMSISSMACCMLNELDKNSEAYSALEGLALFAQMCSENLRRGA